MKRFMKGCAITALIFGVIGMACAMVGGRMAGDYAVARAVEQATGGKVRIDSDIARSWGRYGFGRYGSGILRMMGLDFDSLDEADIVDSSGVEEAVGSMTDERVDYGSDAGQYGDDHEVEFSHDKHVFSGDVARFCPGENIRKLEIDMGGCQFETVDSPDDQVYLEARDAYRFQGYVEDRTLHVISVGRTPADVAEGTIILYLPEGYRFDEVEAELGAGVLYFGSLSADKASLEVGAGEISVDSANVSDLEVSVGAGSASFAQLETAKLDVEVGLGVFMAGETTLGREADVECSMGSVEMTLAGREQDFNFQLECAMGSIDLGTWSYTGLGQEKDIDNGAARKIDLECSMGYIDVQFTEN